MKIQDAIQYYAIIALIVLLFLILMKLKSLYVLKIPKINVFKDPLINSLKIDVTPRVFIHIVGIMILQNVKNVVNQ